MKLSIFGDEGFGQTKAATHQVGEGETMESDGGGNTNLASEQVPNVRVYFETANIASQITPLGLRANSYPLQPILRVKLRGTLVVNPCHLVEWGECK